MYMRVSPCTLDCAKHINCVTHENLVDCMYLIIILTTSVIELNDIYRYLRCKFKLKWKNMDLL